MSVYFVSVQYKELGLYAVRSKIYSVENNEKQENKARSIVGHLVKSDLKSQPNANFNNKSTDSSQSKGNSNCMVITKILELVPKFKNIIFITVMMYQI